MAFYDEVEVEYYQKQIDIISKELKNGNWVNANLNELKEGDKIIISFCPNSQRYIYLLYPKTGIYINQDTLKVGDELIPLMHPNVSYYGDSRGYEYYIQKQLRE